MVIRITASDLKAQLDYEAGLSNDVLTDTQKCIVKELLHDAETHTRELDHQISHLQATIDALLSQRSLTHARIARFHIALAPQNRVPPEILSMIFLYCLTDQPVPLLPKGNAAPWVLGRVCARWRAIVLTEPRLWARLRIETHHAAHQAHLPALARAVLSRSQPAPVALAAKSKHYGAPLADLAAAHATRIRDLSLTLDVDALVTLLARPPGAWDALETLELEFYREPMAKLETALQSRPLTAFSGAHALRRVALRVGGPAVRVLPGTRLDLPWGQLTHLGLHAIAPPCTPLLQILSECTNLESLAVSLVDDAYTPGSRAPEADIVLPCLRELVLDLRATTSGLARFLDSLHTPALAALTMNSALWNLRWPQTALLAFLARTRGELCTLSLESVPILGEDFGALLRAVPRVRVLRLPHAARLPGDVVAEVCTGAVLPVLEDVECRVARVAEAVELLAARWVGADGSGECGGIKRARIRADDFASAGESWVQFEWGIYGGRDFKVFRTVH